MPKRARIVLSVLAFFSLFYSFPVLADPLQSPALADRVVQAREDYEEALRLIHAGKNEEALPLLERALGAMPEDRRLQADYALCLAWAGAYQRAVEFYGPREADLRQLPYVPRNMAKAYYELRDYPKALELYRLGWSYDPKDGEAFKGVVFASLRMDDGPGAFAAVRQAEREGRIPAPDIDAARALLLEQYGADGESRMAASPKKADGSAPPGAPAAAAAVERLRWAEADAAIVELESVLAQDPGNLQARANYIVALRQKDRMEEALAQFEVFRQAGSPSPYWVTEALADACLYLKKPEEAAVYYRLALEENPEYPLGALLGLVNAYTVLRQWEKAEQVFGEIDRFLEQRELALKRDDSVLARKRYLVDLNSAILARGWFLLSQDRLKEGQEYFEYYLGEAASDTNLRGGLAHAYLWRHWPRRAQEQFEINRTLEPKDIRSLTGLAWTLNTLNEKYEARALADDLRRQYPTSLFIYDLWETLQVEQMWRIQPAFGFTREFSGATEYTASLLLEKPLTPLFSLNTEILRQEAWDNSQGQDVRSDWNRAGLGFRWIVMPELIWWQNLSVDYVKGSEFGSDTRLMWWPTDPLRITADYNSYSLAVPIRPRARGISASSASADVSYLESDLREYGFAVASQWFSDGNVHTFGGARYNQNVYLTPDVKVRAGFEAALGGYSKQDVDYYSPQSEWSVLLTSAIQWVNYSRYEKKWYSGLYLRAGVSGEQGYSTYPVGGVTFEQVYEHSKKFNVTGNVSYDLRVYDGNYTNVVGAYLTCNWYF